MRQPKLKLVDNGWQCSGEIGHYKVVEVGPTLAAAYIKYQTVMRELIQKDTTNAFHQSRK